MRVSVKVFVYLIHTNKLGINASKVKIMTLFVVICILGPVVQKQINAKLGLNWLNLGLNFNPRLLCVVQS